MIAGAKRGKNERQGLHSWHPYYAGYSESFVNSVLQAENICSGAVVLDPWMGSGTTGITCQRQQISCIGTDINPVMSIFSAAKSRVLVDILNSFGVHYLREIINRYLVCKDKLPPEFSLIKIAQMIYGCVCEQFPDINDVDGLCPKKSFYSSVLFVTVRRRLNIKKGSNPTWITEIQSSEINDLDFLLDYENTYQEMSKQLIGFFSGDTYISDYKVYAADSKNLPLKDSSIDLIITSPPYLTRIDYAVSTRLELEIISGLDGYNSIRKKIMGTTKVPKLADDINYSWGRTCIDVLSQVVSHNSMASGTYYIKNKLRYFTDAYQSMLEIHRVLNVGSSAYLVIQNSYYKEIEIPLYDIYCEMACEVGFSNASIVRSDKLRATLGQMNPKSTKYIKDKIYFEKIIKVTK